jgi:hypothetical protein
MQIKHHEIPPLVPVINKLNQSHPHAYYSTLISTVALPYLMLHKWSHPFRFYEEKVRLLCLPYLLVACYMPSSFYPPVLFTIYLEIFYSLMINTFLHIVFSVTFTSSEDILF